MTTLAPATCPVCHRHDTIFIRSDLHADLICLRACVDGMTRREDGGPLAPSTPSSRRLFCETAGCGGPRVWLVAQGRQVKNVCGRCRDELIGVYGWRLEV